MYNLLFKSYLIFIINFSNSYPYEKKLNFNFNEIPVCFLFISL